MTKKQWILLGGGLALGAAVVTTATIIAVTSTNKTNTQTNPQPEQQFTVNNNLILSKTVSSLTTNDESALNAALSAFASLSPENQANLVSEKVKLDQLKYQMADLKKLESFRATHKTILAKTKSNVTVADRSLVEAGYTAYYSILGEVSDATTKLAAEKTKLDDLSAKIRELETEQNKSQAYTNEADEFKRVNAKILAKTKANIAISDKNEVDFAINWYDGFAASIKSMLTNEHTRLQELKTQIATLEQESKYREDHSVILKETEEGLILKLKDLVSSALSDYEALNADNKTKLTSEKLLLEKLSSQVTKLETLKAEVTSAYQTRILIQEKKQEFETNVNDDKTLVQYNELKDSIEPYLTSIYETTKQKITSELGDTPEAKELLTKAEEINKKPSWNDQEMKDLEKEVEKAKEKQNSQEHKLIQDVMLKKPTIDQEKNEILFYLNYGTDGSKIQEFANKFVKVKVVINQNNEEFVQETTRSIKNPKLESGDLVERLKIRSGTKVDLGKWKEDKNQKTETNSQPLESKNGTDRNQSTNATNAQFTATIYFKDQDDKEYLYEVITHNPETKSDQQGAAAAAAAA